MTSYPTTSTELAFAQEFESIKPPSDPPAVTLQFPVPEYISAIVMLPEHDNHGKDFPEPLMKRAISYILEAFSGATEYSTGTGYWLNEDRGLDVDRVRPVHVLLAATEKNLKALNVIAETLAEGMAQDKIFVTIAPAYSIANLMPAADVNPWQGEFGLELEQDFISATS